MSKEPFLDLCNAMVYPSENTVVIRYRWSDHTNFGRLVIEEEGIGDWTEERIRDRIAQEISTTSLEDISRIHVRWD